MRISLVLQVQVHESNQNFITNPTPEYTAQYAERYSICWEKDKPDLKPVTTASLKFHDHIRSHFILQMNQMHQKWSLCPTFSMLKKKVPTLVITYNTKEKQ